MSKQQVSFDTGEARSITKTTDYTMKSSDFAIFADATGGSIHITLPEPSNKGMIVFIQKVDDSDAPVSVNCAPGDQINRIRALRATRCSEGWMLATDGVRTWSIISRSGGSPSAKELST